MQVVVVDEGDPSGEHRVDGPPVDLLDVVLAGLVGRMRLAGEDELNRPAGGRQDADQTFGVVEDEFGPLVAGEAARESDGQRARIEQRAGRDDARGGDVLFFPALARALAQEREEVGAKRLARLPEPLVRDANERPSHTAGSSTRSRQSGGQELVEEGRHLEREPGGHMNAVGDGPDRPLLVGEARPDGRPHVARDLAVQLADAVDEVRRAKGERRHVEERAAAVVVVAEGEELPRGRRRACPTRRRGGSRRG